MHFQARDPTSDCKPYSCSQVPIKPPLKYRDLLFVNQCPKGLVRRELPCDSPSTAAASKPWRSQTACSYTVFAHTRGKDISTQDFVLENNGPDIMHPCPKSIGIRCLNPQNTCGPRRPHSLPRASLHPWPVVAQNQEDVSADHPDLHVGCFRAECGHKEDVKPHLATTLSQSLHPQLTMFLVSLIVGRGI